MMDYSSFCIIIGIGFWTLTALAVCCLVIWTYCQTMYYKWDRERHEQESFFNAVQAAVKNAIDEMQKMDIEQADHEQYGDIENDHEAESSMMQDY